MSETVVWLPREPTGEYVQYLHDESEVRLILWPEGMMVLGGDR